MCLDIKLQNHQRESNSWKAMSLITSQSAAFSNDPAATSNKIPDMFTITSTVTSTLQEEREKDRRKLNLIIHGIPESTSEISVKSA